MGYREYKLFLHKFSFEEFHSKLEEEKDKYFKSLQDSLSDFFSPFIKGQIAK